MSNLLVTWHEPSRVAKGAAASVSAAVFVALVVHAQWGCDRPEPARAPEPAPAPAERAEGPVAPGASPSPAERPEPKADRRSKATLGREGAQAAPQAKPRPYLSSSKSDPDMWARDFQVPSSVANQAPEPKADR